MNSRITKKALLSERYRVDNSSDAARTLHIDANVSLENGKLRRIESGMVYALPEQAQDSAEPMSGEMVADFTMSGGRLSLNFTDNGSHARQDVLGAVERFVADCSGDDVEPSEAAQ